LRGVSEGRRRARSEMEQGKQGKVIEAARMIEGTAKEKWKDSVSATPSDAIEIGA
jgi:hypothetical protein